MNYRSIAKETLAITRGGRYSLAGREIALPAADCTAVEAFPPERGAALLEGASCAASGKICEISVTCEDSFQAASQLVSPLVMNFANAITPGGGFLRGATAQEESLCRCSTLYASLTSEAASKIYRYNLTHPSRFASDYMLLSPNVCVFRDERCRLLKQPFMAAVITVPAPNRRGAALFATGQTIANVMQQRIRIMLAIAAERGYKNLVLGAWGCGDFGNNPRHVAEYFRKILVDEGFGRSFERVRFAVYGSERSKNYIAFCEAFQ